MASVTGLRTEKRILSASEGIGQNLETRPEADGRPKESGIPIRDLGMLGEAERRNRATYATAY